MNGGLDSTEYKANINMDFNCSLIIQDNWLMWWSHDREVNNVSRFDADMIWPSA